MCVLSHNDIIKERHKGSLVIEPLKEGSVQPASVDLHLGSEFLYRYFGKWQSTEGDYVLSPGAFVLAHTEEWIELPAHLCAKIEGKSSLGREGLIIELAGFVDPGWKGLLTLEMSNISDRAKPLKRGMPICQIRFEKLLTPATVLYGDLALNSHYQGSKGVRHG